jgi:hypothetical protein
LVRLHPEVASVADQFVRVRLVKIAGADLRLFEFDYDLTWHVFFLNANETMYGRYGGRDASSAEGRFSLKGLRYAMIRRRRSRSLDRRPAPSSSEPPPVTRAASIATISMSFAERTSKRSADGIVATCGFIRCRRTSA